MTTAKKTKPISVKKPSSETTSLNDESILKLFEWTPRKPRRRTIKDGDAILRQAEETQRMLSCYAFDRETQNHSVIKLVDLCGNENYAANLIDRHPRIVKTRCFEMTENCQSMREYWPNTETGLLMVLRAKARQERALFKKYLIPFLKMHIGQKILRSAFDAEWARAKHGGLLPYEKAHAEAEELANMALQESGSMGAELKALRAEKMQMMARISTLESSLKTPAIMKSSQETPLLESICTDMEYLMGGKYTVNLQSLLRYTEYFLSDRVLLLPSAWKSAEESDHAGFVHVQQAAQLLFKLARECVDQYRQGGHFLPDTILGRKAYAANEGKRKISHDAMLSRTFTYLGKTVYMESHLKIGYGYNKGDTFRAHFCYDKDLQKVVIGHFGKHLDR